MFNKTVTVLAQKSATAVVISVCKLIYWSFLNEVLIRIWWWWQNHCTLGLARICTSTRYSPVLVLLAYLWLRRLWQVRDGRGRWSTRRQLVAYYLCYLSHHRVALVAYKSNMIMTWLYGYRLVQSVTQCIDLMLPASVPDIVLAMNIVSENAHLLFKLFKISVNKQCADS